MSLYVKGLDDKTLYDAIARIEEELTKCDNRVLKLWLDDYRQELENRIENILLGGRNE